jgi:hypothetical protein
MLSTTVGLTHRRFVTLVVLASVSAVGLLLHVTLSPASTPSLGSQAGSASWDAQSSLNSIEDDSRQESVSGQGPLGGELWREFEVPPWDEVRERRERSKFREVELGGDDNCLESCKS